MEDRRFNNKSGGILGAAALFACVAAFDPIPPHSPAQSATTSLVATEAALTNRSGSINARPHTEPEYVLDSPNFIPDGLRAFAAKGFTRKNRWS